MLLRDRDAAIKMSREHAKRDVATEDDAEETATGASGASNRDLELGAAEAGEGASSSHADLAHR